MKKLLLLAFALIGFNISAQTTWKTLSAGTEFSAGIQSDGTLWTWGANMNGQLGHGDVDNRSTPTQLGNGTDWVTVSCGAFHTLAIKTDGTLWSWGENSVYQLGQGNTSQANSPTQIGTDTDWAFINAGYATNHAIKTDGTLWAWGWNQYGQAGNNTTDNVTIPTQIGTDSDWTKISSGIAHTVGLKDDETAWAWGLSANGQLGISTSTDLHEPTQLGTDTWMDISAGHEFTTGIQTDGTLWTWGFNGNGQLGLGHNNQVDVPTQVGTENYWTIVKGGSASSFAINSYDELFACGYNQVGTLGDGTGTNHSSFTWITDDVLDVFVSEGATESGNVYGHHTLLLRSSNQEVICVTGANYQSQLGNGSTGDLLAFQCTVGDLVSLSNEENSNPFKIYPNPSTEYVIVSFQTESSAQFTLYSNTGAKVLTKKIHSGEEVQLKSLDKGIYFYELTSPKGSNQKGKLILN